MNLRYLLVLGTASLLLPLGGAIAFGQTQSAPNEANPTPPMNQPSQCPPPPMGVRRPPGGNPEGNGEPPWAKDLNLSSEQREQIKTAHEQGIKDIEGMRKQLMEADEQMRSLLSSDASREQLQKQHTQIQQLRQQLDDKHFAMMLAERQILTSEQRAQLGKLRQQNHRRR